MEWLNYHHLLYFFTTARLGSVTKASQELNLTQPTLSAQIRALERRLGQPLFARQGRGLVLTEFGQVAYRYAGEIFGLGREMVEELNDRPTGRPLRLRVGVVDAVPKLVAYRLLRPATELPEGVRLVCVEGKLQSLVAELALHHLDLILSEAPLPPGTPVKAFSHTLGESEVAFYASPELARRTRKGFPRSLEGAAMLLPTEGTSLRIAVGAWLDRQGLTPRVVGEFEDGALLKAFGQTGAGVFPAPVAIEAEIRRQYRVLRVGTLEGVTERFYALSAERRLKHPAVVAISTAARERLFG